MFWENGERIIRAEEVQSMVKEAFFFKVPIFASSAKLKHVLGACCE
jgi:hypothetical protein